MTEDMKQDIAEIKQALAGLNHRFDGMDKRFDGMDQRFDRMDTRFDGMDNRIDGVDKRLDGMDQRFDGIGDRFDRLEQHMDCRFDAVEKDAASMKTILLRVVDDVSTLKVDVAEIKGTLNDTRLRSADHAETLLEHDKRLRRLEEHRA